MEAHGGCDAVPAMHSHGVAWSGMERIVGASSAIMREEDQARE